MIINHKAKKAGMEGHFDKDYEWVNTPKMIKPDEKQWAEIKGTYNHILASLKNAEEELDKEILSQHCYKLLYNSDSSRIMIFFIIKTDDPTYDTITRLGRTVHLQLNTTGKNIPEYNGYVLWGMNYNNKWYYTKDWDTEFYDYHDTAAREDFLYYVLSRELYFQGKDPAGFWNVGGRSELFKIIPTDEIVYTHFIGHPEIYAQAQTRKIGLLRKRAIRYFEYYLPLLKNKDSLLYHTFISSPKHSYTDIITNNERNLLLVPVDHISKDSVHFISFLFFDRRTEKESSWLWEYNLPVMFTEGEKSRDVIKRLISTTGFEFNFNYEVLSDDFWNGYVLKKENEKYLYLKELK